METVSKDFFKSLRRIQIRTSRLVTDTFGGAYLSAFKGRGMEFEDVREYSPGDEIRRIDWNVTARMHHPFVKNFREERELTVMLLVDVSASNAFGSSEKRKKEVIAEIGALLSFSAMRNQDKVGLILFSDGIERYLPPKKGLSHSLKVIGELMQFKPAQKGTNLGAALAFLSRVHKRKGICFIISDFLDDRYENELSNSARSKDMISICVSDPRELEFPQAGLIQVKDLENDQMILIDSSQASIRAKLLNQRMEHLQKLNSFMRKIGGDFIDVRTDKDYLPALRECFFRRERRK